MQLPCDGNCIIQQEAIVGSDYGMPFDASIRLCRNFKGQGSIRWWSEHVYITSHTESYYRELDYDLKDAERW